MSQWRDYRVVERLADHIAAGETDEALELLHEMAPDTAPWPNVVKRRLADRRAHAVVRAA